MKYKILNATFKRSKTCNVVYVNFTGNFLVIPVRAKNKKEAIKLAKEYLHKIVDDLK